MKPKENAAPMFRVNDCALADCYFQKKMKACPYANAVETCPKVQAARQKAKGE